MRQFVIVLTLLCGIFNSAQASHILGGEITYEHVENLKYKVWVTIYRDCSECKIAGGGGGSSQKECDSFDLIVQQSDRYSCGTGILGKFSLTRTEIRPIIPVCSSVKTTCESNSNIKLGVEAHVFYTIVDFSKYSTSASCGFDLSITIFDRAGDIDNLEGTSESFYNYAFINPYKEHNSQKFNPNPGIILTANQPYRTVVSGIGSTTDSIVYSLGEPLRAYRNPIEYSSGYSKSIPLTVWCNGSSTCSANTSANPPIGYAFDPQNGSLVFTPTAVDEKAVMVFEAATYRKNGSSYQLIGLVRRDIQVQTIVVENNMPVISAGNLKIDLCAGEKWNLTINAKDQPYKHADGSVANEQTVNFSTSSEISNLSSIQSVISKAPFHKLDLSWQTSDADARTEPYQILVSANDQNCPLNGVHTVLYEVYVHPKPEIKVESKKIWCGNYEKKLLIENNVKLSSGNWTWYDQSKNLISTHSGLVDTFYAFGQSKFLLNVLAESNFGCKSIFIDSIIPDKQDLNALNISVDGLKDFCVGDQLSLKAVFNTSANVSLISWFSENQKIAEGDRLETLLNNGDLFKKGIEITAQGNLGKLVCKSSFLIYPEVNHGPDIFVLKDQVLCAEQDVDLNKFCAPKGGVWYTSDAKIIQDNTIHLSEIDTSTPQLICLTYKLKDNDNGCLSVDTSCVRINPLPRLHLDAVTICNFSGTFNLANLIIQPFGLSGYSIKWIVDGKSDAYSEVDGKYLLSLDKLGDGIHSIECLITNEYGCSTSGITQIELIKDLEISSSGVTEVCQGDTRNLNDILGIQPKGGIWQSSSHYDQIADNRISEQFCGYINLNYTYDRYGCYATSSYTINVICKPTIKFELPDTICNSKIGLDLKATPGGGEFSGINVTSNYFTVGNLRRDATITYEMQIQSCKFVADHQLFIAPAPRAKFSDLPSFLCGNEGLTITDLTIENGALRFDFESDTYLFTDGFIPEFKYHFSQNEINSGRVSFKTTLSSKYQCPLVTTVSEIPLHPVAKLNLAHSLYEGCNPFVFEPNFINSNGNGWDATSIYWNYGDTFSGVSNIYQGLNPSHTYKISGNFDVRVKTITQVGCAFDTILKNAVQVHETPSANFDILPEGPVSVRLPEVWFVNRTKGLGELNYHWDFGTNKDRDTSNVVSPKFFFIGDTGSYEVMLTATNQFGCADFMTKTVRVGQDIQLFIPNAFTPNGKGPELNETFMVVGVNVKDFELEVVNRWGAIVFYSKNINESWDGRYLGKTCQGGIFAYRIKATSNTGGEYEFAGTLNMIR